MHGILFALLAVLALCGCAWATPLTRQCFASPFTQLKSCVGPGESCSNTIACLPTGRPFSSCNNDNVCKSPPSVLDFYNHTCTTTADDDDEVGSACGGNLLCTGDGYCMLGDQAVGDFCTIDSECASGQCDSGSKVLRRVNPTNQSACPAASQQVEDPCTLGSTCVQGKCVRGYSLPVGTPVPPGRSDLCVTGLTTASPQQDDDSTDSATCAAAPDGSLTGQACTLAKVVPGYDCVCKSTAGTQGVLVPMAPPTVAATLQSWKKCFIDSGCSLSAGGWGSCAYYKCAEENAAMQCALTYTEILGAALNTDVPACFSSFLKDHMGSQQQCTDYVFACEPLPARFAGPDPPFVCPSRPLARSLRA